MKCNEEYGCGEETNALFTVGVKEYAEPEDRIVDIKVCRDCAATGDWED